MKKKTAQTMRLALATAATIATLLAMPAYADEMADVSKLLKAGKANEALIKTNEYLAKHPTDPQMRFLKGVILTEQNKSDEAIAVFTKLTEDYKDLPEPYNNLAVLYAASGQYEKARIALEKAIRTNPSYMTAYENLGDVYGKMASQAYDKALALGATSAPTKSKLTLLRTFSASTGSKLVVPESAPAPAPVVAAAPARPGAQAPVALISPLPSPDLAKSQPPQRIPALSVTPPAAQPKVAAAPAPLPAPAPVAAKPLPAPVPAPVVAAAKPAPLPAPAPAPVAAKPAPAPAPLVVAKAEPAKPVPAPVPAPAVKQPEPAKPAPAAAPAKPEPKPEPAKPVIKDNLESDAVLAQVHGWAKAWAAQNVDSYLGYYASEFEPPKGLSRKAWADERRARIEGKGHIRVEISNPEVTVSGNTAKVSFHQTYVSDRLTARSRKTLVLVKNGGKWQIKQESSGS